MEMICFRQRNKVDTENCIKLGDLVTSDLPSFKWYTYIELLSKAQCVALSPGATLWVQCLM